MDEPLATAPGADMTGRHTPHHEMILNEKEIFDYLIHPDDTYTSEGVYWADLPLAKRIAFVGRYDAKEAGRELRTIGRMAKADPLSPVSYYFKNMVVPGAGLGLEGSVPLPPEKQVVSSTRLTIRIGTCCSRSETSSRSSKRLSLLVGGPSLQFATPLGSLRLTTLRFAG